MNGLVCLDKPTTPLRPAVTSPKGEACCYPEPSYCGIEGHHFPSLPLGRVGEGVVGDAEAKSQSLMHGQPASRPLHPTSQ